MIRSRTFALAALLLAARTAGAQRARADVQRFQWDPVVIHLGVERGTGVEVYLTTDSLHAVLLWFPPDSLKAWLPSMDSVVAKRGGSDARTTTPVLFGPNGAQMKVARGVIQGQQAVALHLSGQRYKHELVAWMPDGYAHDLQQGLSKSVDAARKLGAGTAADSALRVYEAWEVDALPKKAPGGPENNMIPGDLIPDYSLGGRVTLEFVVDATGRIIPSTVVLLVSADARLGRQWAGYVSAETYLPARRDGQAVAVRVVSTYFLESGVRVRMNNPRIIPGDDND